MRSITLSALLTVSLAMSVQAAPKTHPCGVSPALVDVYRNPTSATSAEWTAARKAANDLMLTSCEAGGPKDKASRALIFSLLEKELTVDYDAVFAAWQKRSGKPLSESAAEGVRYFQQDLLSYIDRIVSPQDLPHRRIILEYANGLAIAKLGRAVKDEVIQQSGRRPKTIYGLVRQNRQEEAFRAIGYWLDPADATLTAAEKRQHAMEIAGVLPPDGVLHSDLHTRMVTTVVEALGHSDETQVEEKIRSWRHTYENANGTGDTIADLAQKSADKIRTRAQAKK
jgi:hypothetical protein